MESPQPQYLGLNVASISLLQDNTRMLVWRIGGVDGEKYHTNRWFSDQEKKTIESIDLGDVRKIQDFLSKYI